MTHEQIRLYLLQRVDDHTNGDEQRRATEELRECLLHVEQASQGGHDGDEGDEQ